jgi:hypothetical protein
MSVAVPKPEAAPAYLRTGRRLAGGIEGPAGTMLTDDAPRAALLPRGVLF